MSLRVWLPLNKDLRNNGLEDVTVTNNGATFSDSCYSFNGTSNYIQYDGFDASGLYEITVACWVKPTVSNLDGVFSISRNNTWQFGIANASKFSTDNCLIVRDDSIGLTGSAYKYFPLGEIEANKWIHICCSYNRGVVRIYKNGVLYSENTVGGTRLNVHDPGQGWLNNYWVGKAGVESEYFSGKIYDYKLYDHALSLKEVKELAKGLYLHYSLSNPYVENTVNLIIGIGRTVRCVKEGNGVRIDWTQSANQGGTYFYFNTSEEMVSGTTYSLSFDAVGDIKPNIRFDWSNLHEEQYRCYIKEGRNSITFTVGDSLSTFFDDVGRDNTANFWMGNFQLEKKDHATPYTPTSRATTIIPDNSGFGNDGTINGNLQVLEGSPRGSYCTKLPPGTITVNNINIPDEPVTLSFWNKPTNYTDNTDDSKIQINFAKCWIFTYLNYPYFQHDTVYKRKYTNYWNDGKWHLIIYVYDGINTNVYVDGNVITMDVETKTALEYESNLTLSFTDNSISDFRIYKTALSAQDILDLYKTGACVDKNQNMWFYGLEEGNTRIDIKKNGVVKALTATEGSIVTIRKDNNITVNEIHEL